MALTIEEKYKTYQKIYEKFNAQFWKLLQDVVTETSLLDLPEYEKNAWFASFRDLQSTPYKEALYSKMWEVRHTNGQLECKKCNGRSAYRHRESKESLITVSCEECNGTGIQK